MAAAVMEGVIVKSCPHCGSEAHLKTDSGADAAFKMGKPVPGSGPSWYWVKCSNKDCAASHVSKRSAEEAAALWNQRA